MSFPYCGRLAPSPSPSTPRNTNTKKKIAAKIRNAGIEAIDHFTMNVTMLPKGMSTSVTRTRVGGARAASLVSAARRWSSAAIARRACV